MIDNTIEFRITSNETPKWVMKITADRRIEVAEDVEVTEVAKKVLKAMQGMLDKQKKQWVGLTKKEFQEAVEGLEDLEDCWVAIEAALRSKND